MNHDRLTLRIYLYSVIIVLRTINKILGTELGPILCFSLLYRCGKYATLVFWRQFASYFGKNFHVHKGPPLVPVLNLINPFHSLLSYFLMSTLIPASHQTWVLSLFFRFFHWISRYPNVPYVLPISSCLSWTH